MEFSNCPHCIRTISLKDGKFVRHVPDHWKETCKGFKQPAKWSEGKAILAGARNTNGDCMGCQSPVGQMNPECPQCGAHWARGKLKPKII